jgi:chaperonin cofactor prefoldin
MSQGEVEHSEMTRALLTDGERKALTDDEMDDNARSSHLARIKNKLDLLSEDAKILRQNAPELYERARDEFCSEEMDERIDRLESEVETLRTEIRESE